MVKLSKLRNYPGTELSWDVIFWYEIVRDANDQYATVPSTSRTGIGKDGKEKKVQR